MHQLNGVGVLLCAMQALAQLAPQLSDLTMCGAALSPHLLQPLAPLQHLATLHFESADTQELQSLWVRL